MLAAYERADGAAEPVSETHDMVLPPSHAQILLMPAESFVKYQLMAQQLRPDSFVMTIGYGECGPGYIPTASATKEGFNVTHSWCWVAPGAEQPMRAAMVKALQGE